MTTFYFLYFCIYTYIVHSTCVLVYLSPIPRNRRHDIRPGISPGIMGHSTFLAAADGKWVSEFPGSENAKGVKEWETWPRLATTSRGLARVDYTFTGLFTCSLCHFYLASSYVSKDIWLSYRRVKVAIISNHQNATSFAIANIIVADATIYTKHIFTRTFIYLFIMLNNRSEMSFVSHEFTSRYIEA